MAFRQVNQAYKVQVQWTSHSWVDDLQSDEVKSRQRQEAGKRLDAALGAPVRRLRRRQETPVGEPLSCALKRLNLPFGGTWSPHCDPLPNPKKKTALALSKIHHRFPQQHVVPLAFSALARPRHGFRGGTRLPPVDVLFASRHRPDPSADASTQQSQFAIDIRPIGAKWIWAYHANWLWASLAKWIWAVGAIEPQQQSVRAPRDRDDHCLMG
eukprot:s15_g10.t1